MKFSAPVVVIALMACVFSSAAQAEIKTQWVDYQQGDTALQGYLAYDDAITGKRPAVMLLHRRDGMSELTLRNTEMFARQGYVVFAADIFGKTVRPKEVAAFVPPTPTTWVDPRPNRPIVLHSADVFVDKNGLCYCTDWSGAGLYIMEYLG